VIYTYHNPLAGSKESSQLQCRSGGELDYLPSFRVPVLRASADNWGVVQGRKLALAVFLLFDDTNLLTLSS